MTDELKFDPVNRPKHYVESAATIEPIELLRHAPFDIGCAMKYLIRFDKKGKPIEDLKKALWYLDRADETSLYDINPYNIFLDRYGHMVNWFFPNLMEETAECTWNLIEGLRRKAEDELLRLSQKSEISNKGGRFGSTDSHSHSVRQSKD